MSSIKACPLKFTLLAERNMGTLVTGLIGEIVGRLERLSERSAKVPGTLASGLAGLAGVRGAEDKWLSSRVFVSEER